MYHARNFLIALCLLFGGPMVFADCGDWSSYIRDDRGRVDYGNNQINGNRANIARLTEENKKLTQQIAGYQNAIDSLTNTLNDQVSLRSIVSYTYARIEDLRTKINPLLNSFIDRYNANPAQNPHILIAETLAEKGIVLDGFAEIGDRFASLSFKQRKLGIEPGLQQQKPFYEIIVAVLAIDEDAVAEEIDKERKLFDNQSGLQNNDKQALTSNKVSIDAANQRIEEMQKQVAAWNSNIAGNVALWERNCNKPIHEHFVR